MSTATVVKQWERETFRAMGTQVTLSARSASPQAVGCDVEALFDRVESSCSRFDPDSDLSRINRAPEAEHDVAPECAEIMDEAYRAYLDTDGLFDPRILQSLVLAGYDRTFDELTGVGLGGAAPEPVAGLSWRPRVDLAAGRVQVGDRPVDLGGIGKGWTVDTAAATLADRAADFLINAGGDLVVRGNGPTEDGWTVGIEDPRDQTLTTAVLRIHDAACATSSTSKRAWRAGDEARHHLIDPRTGRPASGGIACVTVVAASAVTAETWSKALLIAGVGEIHAATAAHELAAFWVLDDGSTTYSGAMEPYVAWQRG